MQFACISLATKRDDDMDFGQSSLDIDVVSYNVLCSHLSKHADMPRCDKDACDPAQRLPGVKQKLLWHLDRNRIVCLQELSREWYGELLPYMSEHGYTIVPGLYGNKHNNYMGVAVAYPTSCYRLLAASTPRVADGARWPFRPRQVSPVLSRAWAWLVAWVLWVVSAVMFVGTLKSKRGGEDEVERARSRHNQLVLLRLQRMNKRAEFVVGTYHMPCAFDWPDQMRLHAAAAASQALAFANGDPLVLAGDFNFKPDSDCYRLITTGSLTPEEERETLARHPELDAQKHLRTPTPLKSAYVSAALNEPMFTIHSYSEWNGPNEFTGTLDYIFHSDHFERVSATPLQPSPEEFGGPLPTVNEPSDHLLIHANLRSEGN